MTGFDPSALMPLVEPLAVLTGIACVALTVRERISNWPVWVAIRHTEGPARGDAVRMEMAIRR